MKCFLCKSKKFSELQFSFQLLFFAKVCFCSCSSKSRVQTNIDCTKSLAMKHEIRISIIFSYMQRKTFQQTFFYHTLDGSGTGALSVTVKLMFRNSLVYKFKSFKFQIQKRLQKRLNQWHFSMLIVRNFRAVDGIALKALV